MYAYVHTHTHNHKVSLSLSLSPTHPPTHTHTLLHAYTLFTMMGHHELFALLFFGHFKGVRSAEALAGVVEEFSGSDEVKKKTLKH